MDDFVRGLVAGLGQAARLTGELWESYTDPGARAALGLVRDKLNEQSASLLASGRQLEDLLRVEERGNERLLCCPGCTETGGLHVDQAELAGPTGKGLQLHDPGEDDTTGGVLVEDVVVPEIFRSSRRHSVIVTMWCERCGQETHVGFIQHKGETFVQLAVGARD